MSRLVKGLFVVFLFCACNKSDIVVPTPETTNNNNVVAVVKKFNDYKDQNVSIVEITGKQTGTKQINFSFATEYEKNLSSIEVYRGVDDKSLCVIYEKPIISSSTGKVTYSVIDNDATKGNNYYMIKYNTKSGDWAITPLYLMILP